MSLNGALTVQSTHMYSHEIKIKTSPSTYSCENQFLVHTKKYCCSKMRVSQQTINDVEKAAMETTG